MLYTAPEKKGKYQIDANLNGKTASVTIEVDANAPARRVAEATFFAKESPSSDPYRRLVEHYAPFVAQETWLTLLRASCRSRTRCSKYACTS